MAEKEVKTEVKAEPVQDKSKQRLVVGLVVLGIGILALLVAGAIVVGHVVRNRLDLRDAHMPAIQYMQREVRGGYANGTFYSHTSVTDGPTTTTTTQKYTYTTGVVTKVNSDSIVVAGNGKTQTIKTNSSTTYVDDTKPAVNDTVRVVGTADDSNNVTATQIVVLNN